LVVSKTMRILSTTRKVVRLIELWGSQYTVDGFISIKVTRSLRLKILWLVSTKPSSMIKSIYIEKKAIAIL
jgi:hypothetical protein